MSDLDKKISFILLILTFIAASKSEECGGNFDERTTTFSSPSYETPHIPPNNETCEWRITGDPDEKIFLTIRDIDIEKSDNCSLNYVEVRDGHWYDSPLLGRFCGEGSIDPIESSEDKMFISYIYTNRQDRRGFLANYEALCGGVLFVDSEANLTSPNYPGLYPNDKRCIWKIEVHEIRKAVISFESFDLETTHDCASDYVKITNGWSSQSNLLGTFCNQSGPFQILSDTNNLLVEFASDASTQKAGFSAVVQGEYDECLLGDDDCAQICINTIGSYKCDCNPGYRLALNGKDCEVACGGTLNASSGTIEPPDLPNVYPLNGTCTWDIITSPLNQIRVEFTHLDIDEGYFKQIEAPRCSKDKVEIYHKINGTLEHQGDYCGTTIPDPIFAKGDTARIVFSSFYSNKTGQFALDYVAAFDGCSINNGNCQHGCVNSNSSTECVCSQDFTLQDNGRDCVNSSKYYFEISSLSGNISSRNYPNNYDTSNSWWKFMITPGHRIQISFQSFYTESSYDVVTLYDGPSSNYTSLGKFSGSTVPNNITSSRNQMYITFKTNTYTTYKGFLAYYSTICGASLSATNESKYIYSHPTFGFSDYENNTDCEWTITSSSGHSINLQFEIFQLENSANCTYDYLEIFEGDNTLGKFCDQKPPPDVTSRQNSIRLHFHSDDGITNDGFAIIYKAMTQL